MICGISLGFLLGLVILITLNTKFLYSSLYSIIAIFSLFFGNFQYKLYAEWNEKKSIKENIDVENPLKYRFNITDEDKIIFQHLFDRHKNSLSFVDVLDTKFSTAIALNGIILSFTFFRADVATQPNIFVLGLFFILSSICLGIYGYSPKTFFAGMNGNFFEIYDKFAPGTGIKELKDQLTLDLERNEKRFGKKAGIFYYMLLFNIIGLTTLIIGYYV